jgi:hypothetical protein
MSLPPSSYDALDPAMITRRPGSPGAFTLRVQRARLLGVWLEPTVDVTVEVATVGTKPAVRLRSDGYRLDGSEIVRRLGIDERSATAFDATLTWTPGGTIAADIDIRVWAEPVGPFKAVPRRALAAAGDALLAGLTSLLLPAFLGKLAADYSRWAADSAYRAARGGEGKGGGAA